MSQHKTSIAPKGFIWLPVQELRPGMYVSELECAWEDTPFALQGVYLANERDIQRVSEWSDRALVSIEKVNRGVIYQRTRLTPRLEKAVPVTRPSAKFSSTAYWSEFAGPSLVKGSARVSQQH